MVSSKVFALAAIFASLASAAPLNQKRAVVYETVTKIDVVTLDTTITLPAPTFIAAAASPKHDTTTTTSTTSTSTSTSSTSTPTYTPPPTSSPAYTPPPPTSTPPPPPPPPAPAPPAPAPPPPPPPAPAPAPSSTTSAPSGGSGGSGPSGSGDGTYYDTATSMSAPSYCDTANDGESENVVALSHSIMDQALCGSQITVIFNGNTVIGTVVDMCEGCDAESIDLSRHMFTQLAGSLDAGRIHLDWKV